MKRYFKVFSLAAVFALSLLGAAPAEALFQQDGKLPGIIVGEVACYKANPVKQSICDSYRALLKAKILESKKLRLVSLPEPAVPPRLAAYTAEDELSEEEEALSEAEVKAITDYYAALELNELMGRAHMDAMLKGDEAALVEANDKLTAYSKSVGRGLIATTNPYPVSTNLREPLKKLGEKLGEEPGARYILFCHLVGIKGGSIYNGWSSGNKITAQVDYYLIDTLEGKTYRTHKERSKSAKKTFLIYASVGKEMSLEMLLQRIMEKGAEQYVKELEKQCGGKGE